MSRRFDYTKAYWRVEFIRPVAPNDDRCVMLFGDHGEIVGPLTIELAEAWMDHFDSRGKASETARPRAGPRSNPHR